MCRDVQIFGGNATSGVSQRGNGQGSGSLGAGVPSPCSIADDVANTACRIRHHSYEDGHNPALRIRPMAVSVEATLWPQCGQVPSSISLWHFGQWTMAHILTRRKDGNNRGAGRRSGRPIPKVETLWGKDAKSLPKSCTIIVLSKVGQSSRPRRRRSGPQSPAPPKGPCLPSLWNRKAPGNQKAPDMRRPRPQSARTGLQTWNPARNPTMFPQRFCPQYPQLPRQRRWSRMPTHECMHRGKREGRRTERRASATAN